MISLGGSDRRGYLTTVEVTDIGPKNNDVCLIADLPRMVSSPSAVYTNMGLILCGADSDQTSKKCYILKSNGTWIRFHDLTQSRAGFSMTKIKEHLVVIGGSSAESSIEYINIQNGTKWETKNIDFEVK